MGNEKSRDEYFYQQGYTEGYIKGQQIATEEVYKFFKNTDKLPAIVTDKIVFTDNKTGEKSCFNFNNEYTPNITPTNKLNIERGEG
jgi:hypothetical protein